jgi:pilus assembly protein CpaF
MKQPSFGKRDVVPDQPVTHQQPRAEQAPPSDTRLMTLRQQVLKEMDASTIANLSLAVLTQQIERVIHDIANEQKLELSGLEQSRLAQELANDMTGYGPLQSLLLDDSISDIMVNGPTRVYVGRRGKIERVAIRFRDAGHIAMVAQKIAAQVGRRIDESSPMVDARLPDGSRVNVIFPPLALDSPCITIRKFPTHRYDFAGMIGNGTLTAPVAKLLEIAARCRLNVLISGGTGSGKTTLLNAISRFIGGSERIISIEDVAELQLQQEHVIRLETRPPNVEGAGQITQRELVWNALRMYPDRIILGEVRGTEAFDMLQAMNTGHDGSISTIHANSARDALTRVENMVLMGHVNLPIQAIRSQIVGAIDMVVHVERMRDGQRRVCQLTEICGLEGDIITTNDIAAFQFRNEDTTGRLSGDYTSTQALPKFNARLAYFGLDRAWFDAVREIG